MKQVDEALKLLPGPHFEATQEDGEDASAQPAAAPAGTVQPLNRRGFGAALY